MRWIILLAVLGGIFWTANWSYHLLDHTVLITDYWESQGSDESWQLVNYIEGKPHLYTFTMVNGYWDIFKGIWPVWALFILSFFILVPLSIYIYNSLNNGQITAAKEREIDAEERAKKAESDAKIFEQKAKSWAEERVNTAYKEQLSRVRRELEEEWESYHRQKKQVLERESAILRKEQAAQEMENMAKERIANIIEQYKQEKIRFEWEIHKMARARDNAQAGYQRLKRKGRTKE